MSHLFAVPASRSLFDLAPSHQRLRLLVVDADADSRELLRVLFEGYGLEVVAASGVGESMQLMQQTRPDLVISELVLPDADGYTLIDQIRAFEANCPISIPVIALTACAQESDRRRALAAGFCRYLTKPLDIDLIDLLIDTVACVA